MANGRLAKCTINPYSSGLVYQNTSGSQASISISAQLLDNTSNTDISIAVEDAAKTVSTSTSVHTVCAPINCIATIVTEDDATSSYSGVYVGNAGCFVPQYITSAGVVACYQYRAGTISTPGSCCCGFFGYSLCNLCSVCSACCCCQALSFCARSFCGSTHVVNRNAYENPEYLKDERSGANISVISFDACGFVCSFLGTSLTTNNASAINSIAPLCSCTAVSNVNAVPYINAAVDYWTTCPRVFGYTSTFCHLFCTTPTSSIDFFSGGLYGQIVFPGLFCPISCFCLGFGCNLTLPPSNFYVTDICNSSSYTCPYSAIVCGTLCAYSCWPGSSLHNSTIFCCVPCSFCSVCSTIFCMAHTLFSCLYLEQNNARGPSVLSGCDLQVIKRPGSDLYAFTAHTGIFASALRGAIECCCTQGRSTFTFNPDYTTPCLCLCNGCVLSEPYYPIKWLSYNPVNCCNYFMYFGANACTRGIYSVNWNKICCTTVNNCTCPEYCSVSSFNTTNFCTFFTKVSSLPLPLLCCDYTTFCPTPIFRTQKCGWRFSVNDAGTWKEYCSSDMINWYPRTCNYEICFNGGSYVSTGSAIIRCCDCFFNVINSATYIEYKTTANNYERTGLVVSNNDRIYVKNTSQYGLAVNVWGYEG